MNGSEIGFVDYFRNLFVKSSFELIKKGTKSVPRIMAVILITASFISMMSPYKDFGLASGASFDGDYRVDDTGTNKTIQWVPTITRASNGDILTAWYDNREGNGSGLFFAESTDGGKTFGKNVFVNDSTTYTYKVFIHNKYLAIDNSGGTYDGYIYAAWEDLRNDPIFQSDYDVYFARSTDGGSSFNSNIRIVDDTKSAPQIRPELAVDNSGNIYAVWTDLRDTQGINTDMNIYFAKSTNGGASFGANSRVDDGPGNFLAESPTITVNETGVIYVAWHDNRNGNVDIYFSKSTNGGTSFGTSTRITDTSFSTSGQLSFPSLYAKGSNVYIVWSDNQSGNWDIRMAYSINGGTSWSSPIKVNDDTGSTEQYYPDIGIDNNNTIYVAWNDERNGNKDIYSANSTNGGSSFGTNTRVDHDTGSSWQRYSSVVAEPTGGFYIVWEDWRNDLDGKFVTGGGSDGVNDVDIYCAFGGKPTQKLSSIVGNPPTPENLKVNLVPSGGALTLTWDRLAVLNLDNYTLYWSMDGNTYGKLANVSANATILSYTHSDLINGLTYYYKISVTDNNGNESNLSLAVANIPDLDTDLDGVGNENDWDDDGDLVSDFEDDFPLDVDRSTDTDNDGLDDVLDDIDDDNDGYTDFAESLYNTDPLSAGFKPPDFDSDLIPDAFDDDIDNDGVNNTNDDLDFNPYETADFDGDGFGDNADQDDDGDGYLDYLDAFPFDASEWRDTDSNGTGDNSDGDIDGDGVLNAEDAFIYDRTEWNDTDGDGTGDNTDPDIDGDGKSNLEDNFPFDSTEWLDTDGDRLGNNADSDDDNDGIPDISDAFVNNPREWLDTDNDGTGDNTDTDDDNDGYPDFIEEFCGTDPRNSASYPSDVDLDGIPNNIDTDDDNDSYTDDNDAFPVDPSEWLDTDGDGLGDNSDTDDDGDGVLDEVDAFPQDPSEWLDTDGDGLGDNSDTDDDNDGVTDDNDAFPADPSEWLDTNNDDFGDNVDTDDDGDGVLDDEDEFPLDPGEWLDTDNDGLGDNSDTDDDNDGVTDDNDAFPNDPREWLDSDYDSIGNIEDTDDDADNVPDADDDFDTNADESVDIDGDGLGNNFDPDDDNDGIPDINDAFPLNPIEWLDTDGDGTGDENDDDDDGDGVKDTNDKFPLNPGEFSDFDEDNIGDNADQDDDNDGVMDVHDDFPLNPAKSAKPVGVNELWMPMLILMGIVIAVLVLIIVIFHSFLKNRKNVKSDFETLEDALKRIELSSRLLPAVPMTQPLLSPAVQPAAAAAVPALPQAAPIIQPTKVEEQSVPPAVENKPVEQN